MFLLVALLFIIESSCSPVSTNEEHSVQQNPMVNDWTDYISCTPTIQETSAVGGLSPKGFRGGHVHSRRRRYSINGHSWLTRHIRYYIVNGTKNISPDQIADEMQKAFNVWGKPANLIFTRTYNPKKAHISVGFYPRHHEDGRSFDGKGNVLAHAYFPEPTYPELLAGDIHFDEDEDFVISRTGKPKDGELDFFTVALHEIGHSLGIEHSEDVDSVMYPLHMGRTSLGNDDIEAVKKIYGYLRNTKEEDEDKDRQEEEKAKRRYETKQRNEEKKRMEETDYERRKYESERRNEKDRTETENKEEREEPRREEKYDGHKEKGNNQDPSTEDEIFHYIPSVDEVDENKGCEGKFDTMTYFRGELFIIKGKMVWRLQRPGVIIRGYPIKVRDFFPNLPEEVKTIDAMYESDVDSNLVILSGKKLWIFDGKSFSGPRNIREHYGLPYEIEQIDAATYIGGQLLVFSGKRYWPLNSTASLERPFQRQLSRPISTLRGLPNQLDAALTYNEVVYFFKDDQFWSYYQGDDFVTLQDPPASDFWMLC